MRRRERKNEIGENGQLGVAMRRLSSVLMGVRGQLVELLGCSWVRFEVLWGSLGRLWGCFFLAQGSLLSDNREKLDFDDPLSELAMFWRP